MKRFVDNALLALIFGGVAVFVVVVVLVLTHEPTYRHVTVDGVECIVLDDEALSCDWSDG